MLAHFGLRGERYINKMVSLHELCQGMLSKWSKKERLREGLALYYWPRIIGDKLANKIVAERVSKGILWLKTSDPSLTQNLTFFKKQIIYKYNRMLGSGVIRSVRIVTGEVNIRRKNEDPLKKVETKVDNEVKIPQSINEIKDEELRDAFSNFFKYHSSLRKKRLLNGYKECTFCRGLYREDSICFCQKKK